MLIFIQGLNENGFDFYTGVHGTPLAQITAHQKVLILIRKTIYYFHPL